MVKLHDHDHVENTKPKPKLTVKICEHMKQYLISVSTLKLDSLMQSLE
jgi:hypothetical protein